MCSAGRQPWDEKMPALPFPSVAVGGGGEEGKRLEIQQPRVDTLRYTHAAPPEFSRNF